jgi:YD repeat-containing protein
VCVDEDSFVSVVDTVSRRQRRWRLDFDDDGKVVRVTDIDVNRQGRIAWISRDRRAPEEIQVQTESATEEPTVLDSGPDIGRNSLAISGTTLYWTKAGAPQAAELTAP